LWHTWEKGDGGGRWKEQRNENGDGGGRRKERNERVPHVRLSIPLLLVSEPKKKKG
jgi:hypothetical protein